jgi:alginate O-acetyltransferase complex protein AlgI
MLFNSYEFLFGYLPIVFFLFFLIAQKNHQYAATFLGVASLFFYAWFSIKSLPLLLGSIVINYLFGLKISKKQNKKLLITALIFNLALLSFFKYANFLIENSNTIIALGSQSNWSISALDIALPIGISFFTFTQIAFLVDCYQEKVQEKNFSHYLLFVTYFPHLIAGPVLHHAQMMPQFADNKTYQINYQKIALGVFIFTIGLAKKILIANPLGEYADSFFNAITPESTPSFANSWLGTLAYTFQIYFDFSGYTDMAIGLSMLFGIKLPINFNAPYRSTSIIDFWRRWHISLSTFLRDYLYIPLGGNQSGKVRRYINLTITMTLGGLWHGANWTFVLWGLTHGILLMINHAWQSLSIHHYFRGSYAKTFFWILTFIFICLTWVLFRVNNLSQIIPIYKGLIGLNGFEHIKNQWGFSSHLKASQLYALIGVAFTIIYFGKPSHVLKDTLLAWDLKIQAIPKCLKYYGLSLGLFVLMMYCINQVGNYNPFLYFQF